MVMLKGVAGWRGGAKKWVGKWGEKVKVNTYVIAPPLATQSPHAGIR